MADVKIYHDQEGRILDVTGADSQRPGDFITVPDSRLADDFLETFPLGRYRVRRGKLVKRESLEEPDLGPLELFVPQDLPVEPPARPAGKRRRQTGTKRRGEEK